MSTFMVRSNRRTTRDRSSNMSSGFSLVELLVVLTIISIVIGVLIPSLRAARSSARNVASQSVIKDLSAAAQRFRIDNKRDPGYFSAVEMGSVANQTAGFSQMQNIMLDLAGGVTSATGGSILTGVGPGAGVAVNVDVGLVGATNNAPVNAANLGSTGGYFAPDKRYFDTVNGRFSNGGLVPVVSATSGVNARMPDMIDAFGQPILGWVADPRKGTRFVGANSGAESSRFYWSSNATYLRSTALGREAKNQVFTDSQNTGSLIGGDTPLAHAVSADGTNGSLAVLLANPAFPSPNSTPTNVIPGEPRGTLVFHSSGRDGVYLNTLDSGARKWALTGTGVNPNGIRMPSDGTDPIRDFDDIVQAANN